MSKDFVESILILFIMVFVAWCIIEQIKRKDI